MVLENSEQKKRELLKDYLEMIIFRDIVERYKVRNTHLLRAIINYLSANFAADFRYLLVIFFFIILGVEK